MDLQTFIFIGRSGCGKGTQAELLKKYVEEHDTEKRSIYYLETGERFRNFLSKDGYSNKLAREIAENSELQPSFLAVSMWSSSFIENLNGEEHVFIDGTPRTLPETYILETALNFYKRGRAKVIYINVSREESEKRLLARGRKDDKKIGDIEKRLNWFDNDVVPAVMYLSQSKNHDFYDIDGEQSIEDVHKELISKVFSG
ncbi:MAG: adenylate kinase [Parcubacteria group bacterium LiPW_30]|nr:MAG: adenylate kinase [Parcubacteria group bacterium LiPW_30]